MDQLDLSDFFNTKAQAIDFSSRLSALSAKLYVNNFDLEKELAKTFGIQKRDKFIGLLRNNKIDTSSNTDLKKFFDTILTTISTMPVLDLTIAFEPTQQTMKALSQWFMVNNKLQILFNFTVDTKVVAGAEINFRGKYLDCTVKERFKKIMMETLASYNAKTSAPVTERKPEIKQSIDHLTIGR